MANVKSPAEPETVGVDPGAPAAAAIRAALVGGVGRLRGGDPSARRGIVEGVHRMRTSTRRLRSALRTFRDLVEADWARPLEAELKWLAEVLGAVRDLDVLHERLRLAAGDSAGGLAPLFGALTLRHDAASAA